MGEARHETAEDSSRTAEETLRAKMDLSTISTSTPHYPTLQQEHSPSATMDTLEESHSADVSQCAKQFIHTNSSFFFFCQHELPMMDQIFRSETYSNVVNVW
jgi:hypothetical protein